MSTMEYHNTFLVLYNKMKFFLTLLVCVLFVSAFGEEDAKKVDKRHVVVGIHGSPWPIFDSRFYHYYHGIYKRDTSAHTIQKRDVAEESKPKTEEKRDIMLGYGGFPFYRNYPYYSGYRSYPYLDYYKNYGLYF